MTMKYPITREGYESLKKDREYLLNTKRPQILNAIEEARAHGDLSENAEYDAAKEAYQFLQKKIAEIEEMITSSEIVDVRKPDDDEVVFGCGIVLRNMSTGDEVTYTLVGPYESDIDRGRISISSPLGRALVGKSVGDEVNFNAPGGQRMYEVMKVF